MDLKNSTQTSTKHNKKLHRNTFEASEEESPVDVQQRNIREAEMLISNLGKDGISQQEILADISVLKELAILQESMEWFSGRISEFANDLRRPLGNGLTTGVADGTIKVLTNLALEFDELANTCLLVLHLEVKMFLNFVVLYMFETIFFSFVVFIRFVCNAFIICVRNVHTHAWIVSLILKMIF